jgi:hypothetical protein
MKQNNYFVKFLQLGFNFDDGLLGGVGSGGGGYYDVESDRISGFKVTNFNESEFDKWYDNFNVDSFRKIEYDLENVDVDRLLRELGPGIYRLWEDEWFLDGQVEVKEDGTVIIYAVPLVINNDEFNVKIKPIFYLDENKMVKAETSKEEIKELLKQNIDKQAAWMIV